MLIFKRKVSEGFLISQDIRIVLIQVGSGWAKIGIDAPKTIPVTRENLGRPGVYTAPAFQGPTAEDFRIAADYVADIAEMDPESLAALSESPLARVPLALARVLVHLGGVKSINGAAAAS